MKKGKKIEIDPFWVFIIVIISLIVLFVLYFYVFVLLRPFNAEITQDRPIMKQLCEMQAKCKGVTGPYHCADNPESSSYQRLNKWEKFKGCNNLTVGYFYNDNYNEGIVVESCVCGGLM